MNSGVYEISFINSNKKYIGSAVNLNNRKKAHISQLRNNKHPNKHLQNAFNKYGEENYIFKTLLICDSVNCLLYEQMVLDYFTPEKLYNKRIIAKSNYGIKYPEDVKKKASEYANSIKDELSKRALKYWNEKRANGNMSLSKEHKNNMKHPNSKPKTFTLESKETQRKKLSIATTEYWKKKKEVKDV
jgi:group I intron endonuclease